MEEKKEQCLDVAYNCFQTVDKRKTKHNVSSNDRNDCNIIRNISYDVDDDSHDERWLYHYMLGKIAEKRKKPPNIYVEHYVKSAKYLYESNATYPFKISHSNPQNLSVEALEIFYRITSSIVKYIENNAQITKSIGKLFITTLKNLSESPFALNHAKIDGKCFKNVMILKIIIIQYNYTYITNKYKTIKNI